MPAQPIPQSRPATLMNQPGAHAVDQPAVRGCTQVWNRMNSVNAHWISESFQPVPCWSGWTNSVQAVLQVGNHDHRDDGHAELEPAVVDLQGASRHAATLYNCLSWRANNSRSFKAAPYVASSRSRFPAKSASMRSPAPCIPPMPACTRSIPSASSSPSRARTSSARSTSHGRTASRLRRAAAARRRRGRRSAGPAARHVEVPTTASSN